MKKLMYIFLALPILTGCKEKKSTGAMGGMPTPEISVTKPIVENITDERLSGLSDNRKNGESCSQGERNLAIYLLCRRWTGETGATVVCH